MTNLTKNMTVVPSTVPSPNQGREKVHLFNPDGSPFGRRLLWQSEYSVWPLSDVAGTPSTFVKDITVGDSPFSRWRTLTRPYGPTTAGEFTYDKAGKTTRYRVSPELYTLDPPDDYGSSVFAPSTPGFLELTATMTILPVAGDFEQKFRMNIEVSSIQDYVSYEHATTTVVALEDRDAGTASMHSSVYLDPSVHPEYTFNVNMEQRYNAILTNDHALYYGFVSVAFTPGPKANVSPWVETP